MRVFYSPFYVLAAHSFDTTRKAAWIADSLVTHPFPGVVVESPTPLTAYGIEVVHDPVYVDAVRTGTPLNYAESQGFTWDTGLWDMVCASNGGVVSAARAALQDGVSGSLSSGLHHARFDWGSGYCTFNGLAITAKTLLNEGAVSSVLIIDLDAHFGGGTASLIGGDPRITQLDVSVSMFDAYRECDNAIPVIIRHHENYLPAVRKILDTCHGDYDLVLYNAGMDPYQGDGTGGLHGIDYDTLNEREQIVFRWCSRRGVPVAFVLAGGYTGAAVTKEQLVGLHRLTVGNAARTLKSS